MATITCVLVEDEPLAYQMISGYIAQRKELQLIAKIDNLKDFYSKIRATAPSIVFLDFRILGFDGDITRMLGRIPKRSIVVSISACPLSHFQNMYGIKVTGKIYELLKPFSFEKFNRCINDLISEGII